MGQIKKMGGMRSVIGMLPGMGGQRVSDEDIEKSEKEFVRMEAIISSMTMEERNNPEDPERQQAQEDISRFRPAGQPDKRSYKALRGSLQGNEAVHKIT